MSLGLDSYQRCPCGHSCYLRCRFFLCRNTAKDPRLHHKLVWRNWPNAALDRLPAAGMSPATERIGLLIASLASPFPSSGRHTLSQISERSSPEPFHKRFSRTGLCARTLWRLPCSSSGTLTFSGRCLCQMGQRSRQHNPPPSCTPHPVDQVPTDGGGPSVHQSAPRGSCVPVRLRIRSVSPAPTASNVRP